MSIINRGKENICGAFSYLGNGLKTAWEHTPSRKSIKDGFTKSAQYAWDASKRIPKFAKVVRHAKKLRAVLGHNTEAVGKTVESLSAVRILMGLMDVGEGLKKKSLKKVVYGAKEIGFGACYFKTLIRAVPMLGPLGIGAYMGLCGISFKEGMKKPGVKQEASASSWALASIAWMVPYVTDNPAVNAAAKKIGIAGCIGAAAIDATSYLKGYQENNPEKEIQALDDFAVSLGWMFSLTGNPVLTGVFIASGLVPRILYKTSPKCKKFMDKMIRKFDRNVTEKIISRKKKEDMGPVCKALIMDEGKLIEEKIDPLHKKVAEKMDRAGKYFMNKVEKFSDFIAGKFSKGYIPPLPVRKFRALDDPPKAASKKPNAASL